MRVQLAPPLGEDAPTHLTLDLANGSYTIHIAAPELGQVHTLTGQTITRLGESETTLISF